MLPGLVLTVGLVAQSIGGLVTPAARNPNAPRFVNIGDDIIQSATARPIAPAASYAPVAPEPPLVVREDVRAEAPPDDAADVAPLRAEQPLNDGVEVVTVFPVTGLRFPGRPHARPHAHAATHHAVRPQVGHMPPQQVMLPPHPTVLLPPLPTVLLPPGFSPQRSR